MPRAIAFVLLVLLAACAQPAVPEERDVAATPAATTPPPPPSEAPPAPELGLFDFSVAAVGGGQVEGAELAGRDVALWFWAPW